MLSQLLANTRVRIGIVAVVVLIALITLLSSCYTVPEGHRGIVTHNKQFHAVVGPGLSLKLPFVQDVTLVDVRTQTISSESNAATSNAQPVTVSVNVNYHLNANSVDKLFSQTGLSKVESIVKKRIEEDTKAVVALYQAEELLKQREFVKSQIVKKLDEALSQYHIVLEDVQITSFTYSQAYSDAIETKQIAEQEALTAINKTRTVKEQATQAIETAKGKAEAIRIEAESLKQNGGQSYIDMKAVEQWDGKLPVTIAGGGTVPFINVGK